MCEDAETEAKTDGDGDLPKVASVWTASSAGSRSTLLCLGAIDLIVGDARNRRGQAL